MRAVSSQRVGGHHFSTAEIHVYEKPTVEKFGSFRDLTRLGFSGNTDGATVIGANGTTTSPGDQCVYDATGGRYYCPTTS
jgi:hypothetical protein